MGEMLKKNRRSFDGTLGEYYRVDIRTNAIVDLDVDLERLARKLGALAAYETMEA